MFWVLAASKHMGSISWPGSNSPLHSVDQFLSANSPPLLLFIHNKTYWQVCHWCYQTSIENESPERGGDIRGKLLLWVKTLLAKITKNYFQGEEKAARAQMRTLAHPRDPKEKQSKSPMRDGCWADLEACRPEFADDTMPVLQVLLTPVIQEWKLWSSWYVAPGYMTGPKEEWKILWRRCLGLRARCGSRIISKRYETRERARDLEWIDVSPRSRIPIRGCRGQACPVMAPQFWVLCRDNYCTVFLCSGGIIGPLGSSDTDVYASNAMYPSLLFLPTHPYLPDPVKAKNISR